MDAAVRIKQLSPAKRALLELALDKQISSSELSGQEPITPLTERDNTPLSFAQQRLWFLNQLHPGKADYNLPQLLQFNGELNTGALIDSLNAIIARHASLRTTFEKRGDQGKQRIQAQLLLELPIVELLGHSDPQSELKQRIQKESEKPFDLSCGPLIRAKLFRLNATQHTLLVTLHHIITDGWSMEVFNRELGTLYNRYNNGDDTALPALAIQYPDYAVWQRGRHEELDTQLTYWRDQLKDAPQVLDLPTDKSRPAVQSFAGRRYSINLPPHLSQQLRQRAQSENATLFMVLLSAWQLLLHRYSGQNDILIGTPIAGRNRTELEPLIGFFVNSLVIRAQLKPQLTFRELLAQTRDTTLAAYEHQTLPFERLVEALTPQRDMSRNPLFQVMFSLQNDTLALPQMDGLEVHSPEIEFNAAKFDLTLFISETDNGLCATFNYATDLFEPATIERMAGHYLSLLDAIIHDSAQTISRIPLLSPTETRQQLTWNATQRDFPASQSLASLFETHAANAPDAVAAIFNDQKISYAELNQKANQLAHLLSTHNVQHGNLVGLCLERSIDALIAMLAILKMGAAYVPLDPAYPPERLTLMIDDAELQLVISNTSQSTNLPDVQQINLDTASATLSAQPGHNPVAVSNGDSLCYIIYTSGSTGKPKGVCVPHKAVSRLVINTDYVQLTDEDVIAQAANTAFDAATFEIWGALLNGGRIVIVPKDVLLSQQQFTELLRSQNVTTLFLTTALFNQMVHADAAAFSSLKQLLFGGEACDPKRIRQCLAGGPPQRLLHVYGPTETTTFATWFEVGEVGEHARTVPIGQPIANTTCYVLDRNQQSVPVGVTGELYIGGPGVALEYLRRPELNIEKFITDPHDTGHLYRTGDLVRYRADGAIEFVGRVDHQIKLRGFRIELGEIDEALNQHPQVNESITLLREDSPGDKRLAAYITARPGESVDEQGLRKYLKGRLPEYMVPSAFVVMAELPLTTNGKIDRKALPEPKTSATTGTGGGAHNALEFHLVKIWEDVLGVGPVGIRDNFFELGGHSLLAVKLFEQIEMHFGKKLPLDTLWFEGATIETLAGILEREQESVLWPELVPIKTSGDKRPLFCIHTMGGNLFHYYELARSLDNEQPVYGLQAQGVYGKKVPRDNVAAIAADSIQAMKQRQPEGPYRLAGFSSGGLVAYEMAQQLRASGERVSSLVLLDCYAPGVQLKGYLWKQLCKLFTLKDLRDFQERIYHAVLRPLGLRRLRQLNAIGEAHRWAHWSYKPVPYAGRIDLFVAESSEQNATDPLLGWNKMAKGDLVVHRAPGTHGLMVKHPNVEVLAQKLQTVLDQDD